MHLYECIDRETRERAVGREDKILRRAIKYEHMKAIGRLCGKRKGSSQRGHEGGSTGVGEDEHDT